MAQVEVLGCPDALRRRMWGRNIRRARVLAGYRTQRSFGLKLGVTKQTVGKWESGKAAPRDPFRELIGKTCGRDPGDMFPLGGLR